MKNRIFTLFAIITAALVAYGLYQALVAAPTERTLGDIQRIFYIHVPSAWVSFLCFFVNFVASIFYLARRNAIADAWAISSASLTRKPVRPSSTTSASAPDRNATTGVPHAIDSMATRELVSATRLGTRRHRADRNSRCFSEIPTGPR